MAFFIITGRSDCPNTAHALHVAEYLHKHLPHFHYRTLLKSEADWQAWLEMLNTENKWHELTSPVVWKEVNRRGGKRSLIGGLSEFWEYCHDYYGFQSKISKLDLGKIMADNAFIASLHSGKREPFIISVLGALNPIMEFLIIELQNCFADVCGSGDIHLRLHDLELDKAETNVELLLDSIEELSPALRWVPGSVSVVTSLPEALHRCDLLLVLQDFGREPGEAADGWLNRCFLEMMLLAEEINSHAKRNLRVVLCHRGPICFNASVLAEYCTRIRLANIVAVTADEALPLIAVAADKCGEPVASFCCPPVWGFAGILSHVDVAYTVLKAEVMKPFRRALAARRASGLPRGVVCPELRFCNQLTSRVMEIYDESEDRKDRRNRVPEKKPMFVKIRALISLINLWYGKEVTDDIISLGVCSNGSCMWVVRRGVAITVTGSFGFPPGVVFSQTVIQNEKRFWEPCHYPLKPATKAKIKEIIVDVAELLKKFNLGEKMG